MPNIDEQEDFLRKKIDESAFGYNDKYWEDAKQLLGTKRRRKFAWWWLPVFILLPVIASVSYFGTKEKSRVGHESIASNHTIASTAEGKKPAISEPVYSATITQTNNITPVSGSSVLKKNFKKIKAPAKTTAYFASLNNTLVKKKGKLPETISSVSAAPNIISSSTNTTGKTDQRIEASGNEAGINIPQNNNPDKENLSVNNSTATQLSNDVSKSNATQPSIAETSKLITTTSVDTTKPLVKDSSIASIPKVINKIDSASGHSLPKNNIRNKILSISIGCNFSKGINANGGNSFTVGALPYAGVSFAIPITADNKAMIRGGLICNMYNQLHSQTQVHHSNYYGFGYGESIDKNSGQSIPYTDTVFTLNQQWLFTLQLPVVFNYYINGKNSISIGGGVAYTLGVYNKVINFNGTETTTFGYGQGYKPFNAFLQLGYCYNFTTAWAIELNIQQGLTDMTDDAFFNTNRKDRFTNLQVGLKHEFLIKSKKNFYEKK